MTARMAAIFAALLLLVTACSRPAPGSDASAAPAAGPASAPAATAPAPAPAPQPSATPNPVIPKILADVQMTELRGSSFTVEFVDEQYGWLVGERTVKVTGDGGRTWRNLRRFDGFVQTAALLSREAGWVATSEGLFATADGGQTWTPVETPGRQRVRLIQFATEQAGWVTVASGTYATNDGGKSWVPLTTPCGGSAEFISRETGWALCSIGGGAGISINELHRTDDGGASWTKIATPGTAPDWKGNMPLTSYTSAVVFSGDGAHGWIGGAKGDLYATSDGGHTWKLVGRFGLSLGSLHFFTPERGFAVLTDRNRNVSTLVATQDGGKNWAPIYPVAPAEPEKAKRLPDGSWVAIGTAVDPGALLTRNGDGPWRLTGAKLPDQSTPGALSFIDPQHGWVAVTDGQTDHLYQTNDGGQTWREVSAESYSRWTQIEFVDEKTGFLADQLGPLRITRDGGATFENQSVRARDVRFVNPKQGWLLTDQQKLMATADGGATWNELTLPTGAAYAFDLLEGGTGAVIAGNRPDTAELYVTADQGKSWTWVDLGDVPPRYLKLTGPKSGCIWDGVLFRRFCSEDGFQTWTQVSE